MSIGIPEVELRVAGPGEGETQARALRDAVRRQPAALAGGGLLTFFVVIAVLAPWIEPHGIRRAVGPVFEAPSSAHWLGLDDVGVDVVSLLIEGARSSLVVGFAAALVATLVGGAVGIAAGYFGGVVDAALMRVTDYFLVVPDLPLMIIVSAIWGQSVWHIILVIGLLSWTWTARTIRAQVTSLRERTYMRRVHSLGAGHRHIIVRHLLPQVAPLLLAVGVRAVANAIFAAAALAFLGLGDPTVISWGAMIQHAFERGAVSSGAWWAIVPPGVCIALVVVACYLLGQAIADLLNPRSRALHLSPRSFAVLPSRSAEPPATASLLEVRGLDVYYELPDGRRAHAVQGVDLTVDPLQRVGLIGESGCGKTTVLLAMMGLLPPTATVGGEVLLDGEDLLRGGRETLRRRRWADIAMVFQGTMNALSPVHTVGQQIVEPMQLHGTASGAAARRRTGELLERVGLPAGTARRYPHELSGGMRQRAGIAMALACEPRVLLADEPTTALDVITQAQILDLLVELTDEAGLALVLVTHDLPVVTELCQRAAVMYAGEIVEEGPTESLYRAPRHPYTRRLLAATPTLDASRGVASIAGAPPRLDEPIAGCPFRPRCRRASDRCHHEHPRLRATEEAHAVACHHEHSAHDPVEPTGAATAPPRRSDPDDHRAPLLDVSDLVVRYPLRRSLAGALMRRPRAVVDAVSGVSVSLQRGEMLALVGESGAGKTTVAMAIMRLVDAESGSLRLGDRDIGALRRSDLRPLRRRMQLIYQDPYESLDPRFRVRDIVAEPLVVHEPDLTKHRRTERVVEALARTGLTPPEIYLDRYPHELSGGQRQRTAIAASLVLGPDLLVADEPVSMLDVSARAGVLDILAELRTRDRMGIIMITHDLTTAAHYCDRIAVMHRGRIVEEGPARTVIGAPQHEYTTRLLEAIPAF